MCCRAVLRYVYYIPRVLFPFDLWKANTKNQVVESVLVINPGTLSKRRAAGTYARMVIQPRTITDEERVKGALVSHKLWERARVDIVKI